MEHDKNTPQKRYNTLESVGVEIYGHQGSYVAQMKNLSQTGAFLEVNSKPMSLTFQKGDLLRLDVQLQQLKKSHFVDAEIIWSNKDQIGVAFITKDELLKKMIFKP